ncbi:MAG: hypothetical protein IJ941_04270, partial [Clostridia bacterium]|nr:hypothetical protein [Clostridia bacterium]
MKRIIRLLFFFFSYRKETRKEAKEKEKIKFKSYCGLSFLGFAVLYKRLAAGGIYFTTPPGHPFNVAFPDGKAEGAIDGFISKVRDY